MLHEDITGAIIGAFYDVHNTLGTGFLEKVTRMHRLIFCIYEESRLSSKRLLRVHFHGVIVGEYYADLLVANKVIVELKTAERIHPEHLAQLSNYLKATPIEVGLLLNFGRQTSFKRVILTNDRKTSLSSLQPNSPRDPNSIR